MSRDPLGRVGNRTHDLNTHFPGDAVKQSSRVFLTMLILFFGLSECRCQTLPAGFQQLLNRTSMSFAVPPGFSAIPVVPNDDVAYDYALRSQTMKLEMRYRILPVEPASTSDARRKSQLEPMLLAVALNISGGQEPNATYYPKDAVKSEFGADAGATCAVKVSSEFGRGYALCLISAIHRDGIADAYVFYLCDDLSIAKRVLATGSIFHALRFK